MIDKNKLIIDIIEEYEQFKDPSKTISKLMSITDAGLSLHSKKMKYINLSMLFRSMDKEYEALDFYEKYLKLKAPETRDLQNSLTKFIGYGLLGSNFACLLFALDNDAHSELLPFLLSISLPSLCFLLAAQLFLDHVNKYQSRPTKSIRIAVLRLRIVALISGTAVIYILFFSISNYVGITAIVSSILCFLIYLKCFDRRT